MRKEYEQQKVLFLNRYFYVDNRVLVPRKKTEMLVIKCLNEISKIENKSNKFNVIEIGTGSGAVIESIAGLLDRDDINYIGTDISEEALQVAKKQNNSFEVSYLHRDLINKEDYTENDIIIANLPYLKIGTKVSDNIKEEPELAVFDEGDGLKRHLRLMEIFKDKAPKTFIFENDGDNIEKLIQVFQENMENIECEIYYDNLGEKRGGVINWLLDK